MAAVTFDTLKFVERLKAAGVPEEQAKALSEAQREVFAGALDTTLATKADVVRIETELKLMKWMIGATFAAVMAVLVRLFLGP
jgi:protein-L-isoaspartate O-methyltransferase